MDDRYFTDLTKSFGTVGKKKTGLFMNKMSSRETKMKI